MGKTGLKLKAKKRKIPILSAKNSQSKCGITVCEVYTVIFSLSVMWVFKFHYIDINKILN